MRYYDRVRAIDLVEGNYVLIQGNLRSLIPLERFDSDICASEEIAEITGEPSFVKEIFLDILDILKYPLSSPQQNQHMLL